MDEKLKKQLEDYKKGAKVYVDKGPKVRIKSSLDYIIKTKKQAAWFRKALEAAKSDR